MDYCDDLQIVHGQGGLYYDILTADGVVRSLSKAGVDACVRYMLERGYIVREETVQFIPDPGDSRYMLFTALATVYWRGKDDREIKLNSGFGCKRQCRFENGWQEDPFWFEKGSQKALRNAKIKLIPPNVQNHILQKASERELEKCVGPGERLEYLLQHRGWVNDALPFWITLVYGDERREKKRISWKEMAKLPNSVRICTRSGRCVGVRQYWHMLEGYDYSNDRWLRYRAGAALRCL